MRNYDISVCRSGCDDNGESTTVNNTLRPWNSGSPTFYYQPEWIETDLACPECGNRMLKNNLKVCTSNPVQYEYKCSVCGSIHYRWC